MASRRLRRLGIITAGGDCPGLNAVIRAVTRSAVARGLSVLGFQDGYRGLVLDQSHPLDHESVAGILSQGGTILGSSNRDDPFRFVERFSRPTKPQDRSRDALATLKRHDVDALLVLGGDGSMAVAQKLALSGLRVIGVPKTIDNDLVGTERCFGHDTAVAVAVEAIDRLHTTASSHHRVMVVELMGRDTGWLALGAGLASGADAILIPEIDAQLPKVAACIKARRRKGRAASIVVVAEGARPLGHRQVKQVVKGSPEPVRLGGVGESLAKALEAASGVETRSVVLGHVVRGGRPTAFDRNLATELGVAAVELALAGGFGRMVAIQRNALTSVPLKRVAGRCRPVPPKHGLVRAARLMGVSFGDA